MTHTSPARREFLRGAALLTAASYSRVLGANDKIRLGVIGCGSRGLHDMSQFQMQSFVELRQVPAKI